MDCMFDHVPEGTGVTACSRHGETYANLFKKGIISADHRYCDKFVTKPLPA